MLKTIVHYLRGRTPLHGGTRANRYPASNRTNGKKERATKTVCNGRGTSSPRPARSSATARKTSGTVERGVASSEKSLPV